MVKINTLKISNDGQYLMLDVLTSPGDTFTGILLWTDLTYRDVAKSIDLGSHIIGNNNREILNIPVALIEESGNFDGIYFVEFTSTDTTGDGDCTDCGQGIAMGVTADLTKYHECVLEGAMDIIVGKDNSEVLEAQLLLDSIYTALRFGWYERAISMLRSLEIYCTGCATCGELEVPSFKKNIGFGILNKTLTLT